VVRQAPAPLQSVSQAQESEQMTPSAQLPVPLHSTSQGPVPQVTRPWQVPASLQMTVQEVADEQFMAPMQAAEPV